jgi:hypothetical protein
VKTSNLAVGEHISGVLVRALKMENVKEPRIKIMSMEKE